MTVTRRLVIAGLAASAAGIAATAGAEGLARSPRPAPRPGAVGVSRAAAPVPAPAAPPVPSADALIAKARLGGNVSYAVADVATGRLLEVHDPLRPQPPASTAKALTALYVLDALGADRRLATRLIAAGPVSNGRIEGDLILAGGGDPTLDTAALAKLAAALKDAGVREVAGALRTWGGGLPELSGIDEEQPPYVGYNPGIGGLTLNHGRVHFEWVRGPAGYTLTMDARGPGYSPAVSMATMQLSDRTTPVYTYADVDGRDDWTVARGALGPSGARWLPVRRPAAYAADVFATLARSHGIVLGDAAPVRGDVTGTVIATHLSPPLVAMTADMLNHSTNATAETLGLLASATRGEAPTSLAASAGVMNGWLAQTYAARSARLEDHSGLGDGSRITALDMARTMARCADGRLPDLFRPFETDHPGLDVAAKTGTLNFVSALAGYAAPKDGPRLAFAIFCADTARRDALPMAQRERPEGGRDWAGRARALQRALLARWSVVHAT